MWKKKTCRCRGVSVGVVVGAHTGGTTVEVDVRVSATDEPSMKKKKTHRCRGGVGVVVGA
jgi:hypothetical protein